jgi:hypothetical protein
VNLHETGAALVKATKRFKRSARKLARVGEQFIAAHEAAKWQVWSNYWLRIAGVETEDRDEAERAK